MTGDLGIVAFVGRPEGLPRPFLSLLFPRILLADDERNPGDGFLIDAAPPLPAPCGDFSVDTTGLAKDLVSPGVALSVLRGCRLNDEELGVDMVAGRR